MAVNPKQKSELSDMWNQAEEAGGSGLADGTYQFKILKGQFKMTSNSKPCFKTMLEIVAGADDMVGETVEINDNLETRENMGWFKSRLARLNISLGDLTFEDIENGTLGEQLKGKVFEGQAKTKGGFLNVYVNRLIGEGAEVPEEEAADEEQPKAKGKTKTKAAPVEEAEEAQEETEDKSFEEGDTVAWNGKTGEVVEVLTDEGLVRVKKEDGTIVRVKLESLEKAENGEQPEEAVEEKPEGGEFVLPEPKDVDEMSMKDVKDALKQLDIDASEVKSPRGVLMAFCVLADDANAKIELSDVAPLAAALEVKIAKGVPFKDQLKALSKAVQAKLS